MNMGRWGDWPSSLQTNTTMWTCELKIGLYVSDYDAYTHLDVVMAIVSTQGWKAEDLNQLLQTMHYTFGKEYENSLLCGWEFRGRRKSSDTLEEFSIIFLCNWLWDGPFTSMTQWKDRLPGNAFRNPRSMQSFSWQFCLHFCHYSTFSFSNICQRMGYLYSTYSIL